MFRKIAILSLMLVAAVGATQRAQSQDDIEGTLTRAQALYYEARFKDSIDLLLPMDATLRQRPDRVRQSISVKLQLALGYIGQNQLAEAKSVFQEVCALDSNYALDSTQFAPKVLALFDEARADHKKAKCDLFCGKVNDLSQKSDAQGLVRLAAEAGDGCSCGAAQGAADLVYKQGVEFYRRDEFARALESFRAALKFRPQHDLATQYAELAESKIKFTIERSVVDWGKSFEAKEYSKASGLYRQLESLNIDGNVDAALQQMRGEYRKVVRSKVDSWNQSCSSGDALVSLDAYRQQTQSLLPNESLAADEMARLTPCPPKTVKVQEPVKPAAAAQGCLSMTSQQAMVRIKSRVNPDIPTDRLPMAPLSVPVRVRIDETGNVSVKDVRGANPFINQALRTAIEKWKFLPALADDQKRCVDVELAIMLSRS